MSYVVVKVIKLDKKSELYGTCTDDDESAIIEVATYLGLDIDLIEFDDFSDNWTLGEYGFECTYVDEVTQLG